MTGKPSKYRNVKTVVDGITFASKVEAKRYGELKLLEKAGELRDLELHPRYALYVNGKKIGSYTADFAYDKRVGTVGENGWLTERVVEDVKSRITAKTEAYRLRKKVFEACYGITITEITK